LPAELRMFLYVNLFCFMLPVPLLLSCLFDPQPFDEGGWRRQVESQELNYDPNGDRIWSDSLTVLREQGTISQGMGFTSDLDFRQARVGPGSIRNTGGGGGRDPGTGGGRDRP